MTASAPQYVLSPVGVRGSVYLGSLFTLLLATSAHGALYACTNAAGTAVITDSPSQLRNCMLLSSGRSAAPERLAPVKESASPPANGPETPRNQQTQASMSTVPLERLGSLWVVTIQVNGTRPAKLILDTGASHTMLSFAVARDLALWAQSSTTSMTMHTAGGTVKADVVPIASISIGGAEVRNTFATIYDLPEAPPGIEGLLGQDFLRHFEVTLNAVKGELQLRAVK